MGTRLKLRENANVIISKLYIFRCILMFTFYDSSNGSIQSLPEDYLRLSLKDIKNAIYQKSQIQSEKQILLSPQGMRHNS